VCVKLQVSFAEYCLFYRALLQKRPKILSRPISLRVVIDFWNRQHQKQVCLCVSVSVSMSMSVPVSVSVSVFMSKSVSVSVSISVNIAGLFFRFLSGVCRSIFDLCSFFHIYVVLFYCHWSLKSQQPSAGLFTCVCLCVSVYVCVCLCVSVCVSACVLHSGFLRVCVLMTGFFWRGFPGVCTSVFD